MFKNKKAVILDLDGTLIDSLGIYNKLDYDLIKLYGGCPIEDLDEIGRERDIFVKNNPAGEIYLNYCKYLAKKYNLNIDYHELRNIRLNLGVKYKLEEVELRTKAKDFLEQLEKRNFILFLATISTRKELRILFEENIRKKENRNLIEIFKDILTVEDVYKKKPEPEIYLKAIEKLEINPTYCIVIEDSIDGIKAAKQAGLEVIAIKEDRHNKYIKDIKELADYYVEDYEELINILEEECPLI